MPIFNNHDPLPPIHPGECHVACALAVDNSSSMSGNPIAELNSGLVEFGNALEQDPLAQGRAEVTVISFNSSVNTEMSFRPATEYEAPTLSAGGLSTMNEAINIALDALEARKAEYRANGIRYYRPWLFLLTDGAPTDTQLESSTRTRLQKAIKEKKVVYLPIGISEQTDIAKLQIYYPDNAIARPVLKANASNFKEAFQWLSASIVEVTHSDPTTTTEVQTPELPTGFTLAL